MAFRPLQDRDLSLSNLQDEMNRVFERFWHAGVSAGPFDGQQWAPLFDLFEYPEHYTLYVEVAGVDPSGIEMTHVGRTLTVRGEKVPPTSACDADRTLRKERRFGTFCRSVELPEDSDVDRLSAKSHAGVLTVTIPKTESSKPKPVKIQVEED